MGPEIETKYGRLQGAESAGIRSFKGIRYAAAPKGARRFQAPLPPEPWEGVREATQHGPAAAQYALPYFGWISGAGVKPGTDCLSLNVWTPGLDNARRPVLVWIHGGGFMVGSGSTAIYDGTDLARRSDAVVVTINYRLGALGYVHLGSALAGEEFAESSNLGVRDQIAALEWVREHIGEFGGDRDNVTLFGQSAGGMSIGALLGAPRARELFHRAICMSGAGDTVIEPEFAHKVARRFLGGLGGPPPTQEALGKIPIREILRVQGEVMAELSDMERMMIFVPVIDGDLIPEHPVEAVRSGATADISLLIGSTLDEWKLFRMIDPGPRGINDEQLHDNFEEALRGFPGAPATNRAIEAFREALSIREKRASAGDVWNAFQTARVFHYSATRLADAHVEGGGTAHHYLFAWRPPALRKAIGACHGLDIPFVFGAISNPVILPLAGFSPAATRLSRKMQGAWANFARTGDPSHHRLPEWEPYEPEMRKTMILGRRCELFTEPLEQERVLLERWAHAPEPPTELRKRA